jgi:hypothetical protein
VEPIIGTVTVPFTPETTDVLLVAFGVEFVQLVNGKQYPLNNGGFNTLAIVKVDTGV